MVSGLLQAQRSRDCLRSVKQGLHERKKYSPELRHTWGIMFQRSERVLEGSSSLPFIEKSGDLFMSLASNRTLFTLNANSKQGKRLT